MTIRAQVMTGLRWTVTARLLAQVITWTITLVVIRILTPADYGLLAMASIFISFMAMFSEFGLGSAVIQRAAIDDAMLRRVFGFVLAIHFSLAVLLFLAAPLVAAFFEEARLIPIVRVLSLQFAIVVFAVIPDALLQRKMYFRGRALIDLSASIVGSIITLGLALAGYGVWSLVASSLIAQVWRTIGVNILAPYFHRPDLSFNGMRSILTFGGHVTAAQILWSFVMQVDVLIGGKWLGKDVLGHYSVAMHLASLPIQRISGIVNQVAFPAFARMQHDVPQIAASLLLGTRLLSFIAFPLLWGISSIAPEIVSVALGPKWESSTVPLQLLALVMPVRMIANFGINAVQGLGRSDIIMRNAVFTSIVMPLAFLIGVEWWGLVGLSVAWLVAAPLSFLQGMTRTAHALNLTFGNLLSAMMPSAGSGLAMYAAVAGTRLALPTELGGVWRMGILVAVGAITYVAAATVLNRGGLREVLGMARSLVPARGGSELV